jgi:hypothetical protein
MLGYRRRLDEIVREQLYPAATTRGGLCHWRRADGLCVLDLGGADSHLQSNLWRRGDRLSPGGLLSRGPLPQPPGPLVSTSALAPLQGCHHLQRLSKRDKCISAYDYSSWSPAASRRVLTFDYTSLRQRSLGSRRLSRGLGNGSGLLGGRRDFFRHR